MSAPDPKEWEATDDECASAAECFMALRNDTYLRLLFASVARRRAVAELKALLGLAYEEGGNQWGQGVTVISASEVTARISAIEAEEGS